MSRKTLRGDAVAEYEQREVSVSVIVPAFNASRVITRTLQSVLNQDLESIQLIIVDDGSTDNTFDVAQAATGHSTALVKIVRQKNGGVSAARNVGLREATGRYIYFLDADDFIDRECLSKLYEKAVSCDADIVLCGCDRVEPSGAVLVAYDDRFKYIEQAGSGRQVILELLYKTIWIHTSSGLYRKKLLDENRLQFTHGCTGGEDKEFIVKALFHSDRVASVSEVLSNYVQRPKDRLLRFSVSKQRRLDSVAAHYRILDYLETYGADGELAMLMKSYITQWYVPSIIASLSEDGCSVQEIMSEVKGAGEMNHASIFTDYSWLSSPKCKVKAAVGNWLLDLSPRLFCLAVRLRHAFRALPNAFKQSCESKYHIET